MYLIVVILIEGMKAWPRRQTGWQTDFPRVMPIVSGDLTREIKNITLAIKDSLLGAGGKGYVWGCLECFQIVNCANKA